MSAPRLLAALRTPEAAKFAPLIGALIGFVGGAIYWLAAQFWPSNVALILSMAATTLLTAQLRLAAVFYVLLKFNALMALSAATLPFAAPENLALPIIMICGYAASFALRVSLMATRPQKGAAKVSSGSLTVALLIGCAPAALLGIPGLMGLVLAIAAGLACIAYLRYKRAAADAETLEVSQQITEVCFYLGALASWRYI